MHIWQGNWMWVALSMVVFTVGKRWLHRVIWVQIKSFGLCSSSDFKVVSACMLRLILKLLDVQQLDCVDLQQYVSTVINVLGFLTARL